VLYEVHLDSVEFFRWRFSVYVKISKENCL
jgi:hypothetical protein